MKDAMTTTNSIACTCTFLIFCIHVGFSRKGLSSSPPPKLFALWQRTKTGKIVTLSSCSKPCSLANCRRTWSRSPRDPFCSAHSIPAESSGACLFARCTSSGTLVRVQRIAQGYRNDRLVSYCVKSYRAS
ncbi:uncharacterized protein M421DRAFT_162607 [Didymella exigua CBS 183.55]|uniref:Uncharacterized protein n=1 Tax=Didymella exigua CBS 183.55 TaxID=1150837 RepID=A0A6A5RJU6_9PLEO|nr:uncharacterized protein M421DRAFT_162607 [Didymella exigua CBS 183.55]KAF1927889.1 hypothetical protein M421DRAFT_162607 [Didymella exigua CBS 183.55]